MLIAVKDPPRFSPAVRWHGRLALEAKRLELPESQLALAALATLPVDENAALKTLTGIAHRHGVRGFAA